MHFEISLQLNMKWNLKRNFKVGTEHSLKPYFSANFAFKNPHKNHFFFGRVFKWVFVKTHFSKTHLNPFLLNKKLVIKVRFVEKYGIRNKGSKI